MRLPFALLVCLSLVGCSTGHEDNDNQPAPETHPKPTPEGTTSSGGAVRSGKLYRCYSHVADGGYELDVLIPSDTIPKTDVTLWPRSIRGLGEELDYETEVTVSRNNDKVTAHFTHADFLMDLTATKNDAGNQLVTGELHILNDQLDQSFEPWHLGCKMIQEQ